MVSPVRVRVPPLLFCRHFQEKRFGLFARPRIERGIHHNGRSFEVLREELTKGKGWGAGESSVYQMYPRMGTPALNTHTFTRLFCR